MAASVTLVPLGGLGEIGMNCMALQCEGTILVLDCGVLFDNRGLGIDVIHADFGWLRKHKAQVKGLVITHGHEDHIGAVPYFLDEFDVPVWAAPYARALIAERLKQTNFLAGFTPKFQTYGLDQKPASLGPFRFSPFLVTHSMPESTGVIIDTPQGRIVHSGDFKIDHNPPEDDAFALPKDLGDVRLLMADSTNALSPGRSGRERDVAVALDHYIQSAPQRLIISLFASNVYRLRAVLDSARKAKKRVVPMGRAIDTQLRVARELKMLDGYEDVIWPRDKARDVPREHCVVVATGSQGEDNAALAKLANGKHLDLEIGAGDLVVLSSRQIPGNEKPIMDMINTFERRGIGVVTRALKPEVHCSGHGYADELREMHQLVAPQSFLPVHGAFVHLKTHAALARESVNHVMVSENGRAIVLDDAGEHVGDYVGAGRVAESEGHELPEVVIEDRKLLAKIGIVVVSLQIERNGKIAGTPQILTRGFVHEDTEQDLITDSVAFLLKELAPLQRERKGSKMEMINGVKSDVRRILKRFFNDEVGRKPMIYALVHQG